MKGNEITKAYRNDGSDAYSKVLTTPSGVVSSRHMWFVVLFLHDKFHHKLLQIKISTHLISSQ